MHFLLYLKGADCTLHMASWVLPAIFWMKVCCLFNLGMLFAKERNVAWHHHNGYAKSALVLCSGWATKPSFSGNLLLRWWVLSLQCLRPWFFGKEGRMTFTARWISCSSEMYQVQHTLGKKGQSQLHRPDIKPVSLSFFHTHWWGSRMQTVAWFTFNRRLWQGRGRCCLMSSVTLSCENEAVYLSWRRVNGSSCGGQVKCRGAGHDWAMEKDGER